MCSVKQGSKYTTVAVTSCLMFLPVLTQANPELVADITPGEQSSSMSSPYVEDDLLKVVVDSSNNNVSAFIRHFSIDSQGNQSQDPLVLDDFYSAIEFGSRIIFTDDDVVWAMEPNNEMYEVYRLPEDELYWDGILRYSVESFFIEGNNLYLVQEQEETYDASWYYYQRVKIDVDAANAEVVENPYYPFGNPVDHPEIKDAIDSYLFNNTNYYVFDTEETGQELWKIQGEGGDRELVLVADIKAGPKGSYPGDFTTFQDEMIFAANGPNGRELWKIDAAGSLSQLADINPKGAAFTYDQYGRVGYVEFQNELYFIAFHVNYGNELWKTDGTGAGTVLVSDAVPGKSGIAVDVHLVALTQDANGFYFQAQGDAEANPSIWVSNGTDAGTKRIFSDDFYKVDDAFQLGEATYIKTADEYADGPFSLWQVAKGTQIEASQLFDGYRYLDVWKTSFQNQAFFVSAEDTVVGHELWISDGSVAGTEVIKDINPGSTGSDPQYATQWNGNLLFSADDGVSGRELWQSDGTADGTEMLDDINPGSGSSQPEFYGYTQDRIYLKAYRPDIGGELWMTDGTVGGARLVKDVNPGPADGTLMPGGYSDGRYLPTPAVFSGLLYFVGVDNINGEELWVSDGTEGGTQMIGPIHPDTTEFNPDVEHPLNPAEMAEFYGDIYFKQYSADYGTELWKYTPDTGPEVRKGALGDWVWLDKNGDGKQSAGEGGLANVTVELQTCDGEVLSTTTTNIDGHFRFDSLSPHFFQMRYVLPSGYRFSPEKSAGDYKLDSNANVTTGFTECIDVTQGWHRLAIDAGMVPLRIDG